MRIYSHILLFLSTYLSLLSVYFSVAAMPSDGNNSCYRNGKLYEDGDVIMEPGVTPCKEYKCRDGVVMFVTYVCPSLRCDEFFKMRLPWECCPRCVRRVRRRIYF